MDHPIQPIEKDSQGVLRFKENKIAGYILDHGVIDLNQLACLPFDDKDRKQFAQLIGYSIGGYADLSYVSNESYETAVLMAEDNLNEKDAKINVLQKMIEDLKEGIRKPIAEFFDIHPDDLK